MKKNFKKIALMLLTVMLFTSCSRQILDFTAISSRNMSLHIDKSKGKVVESKSMNILGFGQASIKRAMDKALAKAGTGYDLLIDGRVSYVSYILSSGYKVKGIAINSYEIKAQLGEDGFKKWCESVHISDRL